MNCIRNHIITVSLVKHECELYHALHALLLNITLSISLSQDLKVAVGP